jgi:hypothetical protein
MKTLAPFEEAHNNFTSFDIKALQRSDLGPYSFEDSYAEIEGIAGQLSYLGNHKEFLRNSPLISQGHINEATARLNKFNELANQINAFVPTQAANPNEEKNRIATEIGNLQQDVANSLSLIIHTIRLEELGVEDYRLAATEKEKRADELLQQLTLKSEEAAGALEKIKEISGNAGATVYSEVFKNQARKNAEAASKWFSSSVVFLVVVFVYVAYLVFLDHPQDIERAETVAREAIRNVLLLSVLSVGLFQSIKNYNANKHLQVVNEHRQNAIETFEAFSNAAPDVQVKSIVLIQATQSIFAADQTGYLNKDSETNLSLNFSDLIGKIQK